jgi:hypothetical protein
MTPENDKRFFNFFQKEFTDWCKENNLPQISADELLADKTLSLTETQKEYLNVFMKLWDTMVEQ